MDYITSDATGGSNMSIPQYVYVTNYRLHAIASGLRQDGPSFLAGRLTSA